MIDKPIEIIREMHSLHQGALINLLACVEYGDYFACSKSDIVWNGQTYVKSSFLIDGIEENSEDQAPSLQIRFSNIGGIAEERVLANNDYEDAWVDLYLVNQNCLTETEPVYHVRLQVQKITNERPISTFKLGLTNPLQQSFPSLKFHDSICQYKPYNTDICPKAGVCAKTLTACLAYGNDTGGNPYIERFGAQPGLMGAIQDDDGL